MEYLFIGVIIIFLMFWFKPAKDVNQITTTELKKVLQDKNKQFIDVRTVSEYQGRHIKQFKNIALHELGQKLDHLDRNKEVYVICQSGMRSQRASKLLAKSNFKVSNVKGGMNAWNE